MKRQFNYPKHIEKEKKKNENFPENAKIQKNWIFHTPKARDFFFIWVIYVPHHTLGGRDSRKC